DRVAALPGVQSVAFSTRTSNGRRTTLGTNTQQSQSVVRANYTMVSSNYFDTMGIPIIRGRAFTEAELRANAAANVFRQPPAKRALPREDPLGKGAFF